MDCFERVVPLVDKTIATLRKTAFDVDPIAGAKYSRATSIVSSAYKRHGTILEAAFVEGMRESNRHKVWQDQVFKVSPAADNLVESQDEQACVASSLPYGDQKRTLQVDLMAYDYADEVIRSYEIKRGFGKFDSGKTRSIKRDMLCTQLLLKSYAEIQSLQPKSAEARIIFYYGKRALPKPWSLVRDELDDHFQFPIVERVERVNTYFQERLHDLLETVS